MEWGWLESLAQLLEYPGPELRQVARRCVAELAGISSEAAQLLQSFYDAIQSMQLGQLEELYTSTFELDATCHPYVGYHLLGESYKRSVFMLRLKELYRESGLVEGSELPDHLALILRYLARQIQPSVRAEIIEEAVLPALERMLPAGDAGEGQQLEQEGAEKREGPYQVLLQAVRVALERVRLVAPPVAS